MIACRPGLLLVHLKPGTMKKRLNTLYLFLIASTVLSCRTTTLLHATFEGDANGNPPIKDVPGAPTGDSILYVSGFEPQVVVNPGVATGKALHFTNASISSYNPNHKYIIEEVKTTRKQPAGMK